MSDVRLGCRDADADDVDADDADDVATTTTVWGEFPFVFALFVFGGVNNNDDDDDDVVSSTGTTDDNMEGANIDADKKVS